MAIHPNHAILREAETMLLLEINDGGHTRGESQDGQYRGGQLEFEFLKHNGRRYLLARYNSAVYGARLLPRRIRKSAQRIA
jgi:hypothetical protein